MTLAKDYKVQQSDQLETIMIVVRSINPIVMRLEGNKSPS